MSQVRRTGRSWPGRRVEVKFLAAAARSPARSNGRIVGGAMPQDAFQALVENAPDAIVVSRDGIVLYANAAAACLLGHDDASELVGKPMTFLDRRAVDVMRRRIEQMAATGERLVPREYPARRRDGTEIVAEIASTIVEFDGAPAVLAYARDVTERTRLRAQLAHADRLAALGTMAAGVAHEINNPLSFIGMAVDMLERRVGPEDTHLVAEVRTGVDRITAIVRDLRFFGRDDDEPPGPIDLAETIAAAERLVLHEIRPRGRIVKEYTDLPPVVGVERHITQVFVQLLLHAAHALDEGRAGRIFLSCRVTAGNVVVTIADDGRGMPPDALAVVFEPFAAMPAAGTGTGLRLSICRDIVVRYGGDLVAKSTVGEGTTMEVTLVRAERPADAAALAPPRVPTSLGVTKPWRVLLVDDEPIIVRALTRALGARAAVVGETVSERALDLILAEPGFDVVVCDVMMPGMSGIDLHARVARAKPEAAARMVFVTGGAYAPRERAYLERIPNLRLEKPFHVARLVAAIEQVARGVPGL
jgi:PAS domain S-box-containing protein